MYALVFCYEGTSNSAPYAMAVAVSNDMEHINAELEKCIKEDTRINENVEWDDGGNFSIVSQYEYEVLLKHNTIDDLYIRYTIQNVKVLS